MCNASERGDTESETHSVDSGQIGSHNLTVSRKKKLDVYTVIVIKPRTVALYLAMYHFQNLLS